MKQNFQFIDYNSDIIFNISSSADTFASTFQTFLTENGWTEEEYFEQLYQYPNLSECN